MNFRQLLLSCVGLVGLALVILFVFGIRTGNTRLVFIGIFALMPITFLFLFAFLMKGGMDAEAATKNAMNQFAGENGFLFSDNSPLDFVQATSSLELFRWGIRRYAKNFLVRKTPEGKISLFLYDVVTEVADRTRTTRRTVGLMSQMDNQLPTFNMTPLGPSLGNVFLKIESVLNSATRRKPQVTSNGNEQRVNTGDTMVGTEFKKRYELKSSRSDVSNFEGEFVQFFAGKHGWNIQSDGTSLVFWRDNGALAELVGGLVRPTDGPGERQRKKVEELFDIGPKIVSLLQQR